MREVLLVGPYPPPFGGPNVHMLYLRRHLLGLGMDCKVLNIGPSRRDRVPDALSGPSGWAFVSQVARWARRGYRVHHFFNVESPKAIILAALAATTARALGGRYSIGFVGGPRQRYLDQSRSPWAYLFRGVLSLSDFVVCNNESVKKELLRFSADAGRLHAIQPFHTAQIETVGEPPPSIGAFVRDHEPVVSTVVLARHETPLPYHEVSLLIDVVGRLRDRYPKIGCVVMGAAECIELFESVVAEADLQPHFHFGGEVAHEDCLATMQRSDVFVRAYMKDGNSSSVRKARALSIPTVASRNPQHPDEVLDFEPNDAGSLAAVLADTLERLPEIQAELGGNGRRRQDGLELELALFGAPPPQSAGTTSRESEGALQPPVGGSPYDGT